MLNEMITQIEGTGLERLGSGRNFSARQIRWFMKSLTSLLESTQLINTLTLATADAATTAATVLLLLHLQSIRLLKIFSIS